MRRSTIPDARCPLRPGDACTLCHPGASGPQDCGLVYLVRNDPELREEMNRVRRYHSAQSLAPVEVTVGVPDAIVGDEGGTVLL